jgi:hypothetical protein
MRLLLISAGAFRNYGLHRKTCAGAKLSVVRLLQFSTRRCDELRVGNV